MRGLPVSLRFFRHFPSLFLERTFPAVGPVFTSGPPLFFGDLFFLIMLIIITPFYSSPLSKAFTAAQPIASVRPAAVVAFIAFPTPGIQPTST